MADYLVAPTPLAQINVLRQAKNPSQNKPLIIQYQHARRGIAACLVSPGDINRIVAASVVGLEQRRDDPSSTPLVRDDAIRSIEVIETFQRSVNALGLSGARYESPPKPSRSLTISGVEVAVTADAVARAPARGGRDRVGEVFIRCAIGTSGDAAENRRADANGHLATIAHMHAAQFLTGLGDPHAPTSMVVDVSRGLIIRGPSSTTRRVANITAACSMIAAIWPTI